MTTMPPDDVPPEAPEAKRVPTPAERVLLAMLKELKGLRSETASLRFEMRIDRRRARGPVAMSEAGMRSPLATKKKTEPMQYSPKSMPHLRGKRLADLSPEDLEAYAAAQDILADLADRKEEGDQHGPKSKWPDFEAELARGLARQKRAAASTAPVAPPVPARAPATTPPSTSGEWEPPDEPPAQDDSADDETPEYD